MIHLLIRRIKDANQRGGECDVNPRLDMPAEYDTLRIGIKNMWLKDNYQGKTCYRRSINSMSLLKVNQAQNICYQLKIIKIHTDTIFESKRITELCQSK